MYRAGLAIAYWGIEQFQWAHNLLFEIYVHNEDFGAGMRGTLEDIQRKNTQDSVSLAIAVEHILLDEPRIQKLLDPHSSTFFRKEVIEEGRKLFLRSLFVQMQADKEKAEKAKTEQKTAELEALEEEQQQGWFPGR
ncbi:MAG: hypothetical protein A3F17_08730 [Gammaproteobacteria bacterium RIFCSPHIGHO2_12_FULL_41_15]|nr:MAG: hypothetical protein A3F17_08730 [Gammaproteobacteria bacterium RIFCSPHIGHO2_12_FULL_41_15]